MPARPIASATISFGLVSVPVSLYSSAESTSKVSFNWLHKTDGSRLKQQYVCKQDGEVVEREDMIKGYEFVKGKYVTFTTEELKALEEQTTAAIEITEFVPAEQVDRAYLSKLYYLGPDKGGDRAYRLLSKAMEETGLAALAKYGARGKQYLVLIRPMGGGLAMEQLHYRHELRDISEVPLGEGEVKDEELAMAVQLIRQAASDEFRPENYDDEVRNRMLEQIQRKVDGEEITAAPTAEPETQIIDLMEALKASLSQDPASATKKPAKSASKRRNAKKKKKKRRAS